jgi:oligogalacturonide lyase
MKTPEEFVDPETGRRVVHLSRQGGESASWYFHNYPFLHGRDAEEDDRLVYRGKTGNGWQLFTINLRTLGIQQVTDFAHEDRRLTEVLGKSRREAFYRDGQDIHAVHIDSGDTRKIVELPDHISGMPATINADETKLCGAWAEGKEPFLEKPRSYWFTAIFEAHLPHHLFTVDIDTGSIDEFFSDTNWLNHLQCSPTDPDLLSFCHEGPWHRLQRMWTIRMGDDQPRKIHERTMENEIAGHEFWDPNLPKLWFDLQMPKYENFFLACYDLVTDEEIRYPIERRQWSVHYNISRDGSVLVGDGGGPNSVARGDNGQYIYLFRPDGERLDCEPLCSLADHDYSLEPNAHFTPDKKWVVFRSNMHGESQVYAVETGIE